MRTKSYKVYNYEELSTDSKEKAISRLRDINVDYDWWHRTFDDAEQIGLRITEFDLDRRRHAKGEFILDPEEVAKLIIDGHGPQCETYKTAEVYLEDRKELFTAHAQEDADMLSIPGGMVVWYFDEFLYVPFDEVDTDEIDNEFLCSLLEDYSIILQNEYEYLLSDEAVEETILINEYEFTEDGTLD